MISHLVSKIIVGGKVAAGIFTHGWRVCGPFFAECVTAVDIICTLGAANIIAIQTHSATHSPLPTTIFELAVLVVTIRRVGANRFCRSCWPPRTPAVVGSDTVCSVFTNRAEK